MFQKYHFFCYRLFCLNKPNNNKTFSCWRNSTTTFITAGRQLLQFENGKSWQFPCIIPFNPQELCQHNLFHNGNARDYPPLSIKKANSWPNRSPKMPTNNAIRQNVQQKHSSGSEKEKYFEDIEKRFLQLNHSKTLRLLLQKGVTGQKILEISLFVSGQFFNFYNISVPQDACAFVKALDELNKELAKENFEQKLNNIKASQSMLGSSPQLKKRELKLRNVLFTGFRHQFQLELVLFINENKWKMEKRICLRLTAINIQATNRNRTLTLPVQTLPWLRKQIAEMLIRHDGTKKIEKEAPAKIQKQSQIPKQFFPKNEALEFNPPAAQKSLSFGENLKKINGPRKRNTADQFNERSISMEEIYSKIGAGLANMGKALKEMSKENVELKKEILDLKKEINGVFRTPPAQNGINSSHSLKLNGVRPQFVNQKPAYFQQYPKMAQNINRNSNQSGIKNQRMFTPLVVHQKPNLQQSGVKKPVKSSKIAQQLDPKTAALERGIQTLFDFDEEEMENYRRISAKINPSEH